MNQAVDWRRAPIRRGGWVAVGRKWTLFFFLQPKAYGLQSIAYLPPFWRCCRSEPTAGIQAGSPLFVLSLQIRLQLLARLIHDRKRFLGYLRIVERSLDMNLHDLSARFAHDVP